MKLQLLNGEQGKGENTFMDFEEEEAIALLLKGDWVLPTKLRKPPTAVLEPVARQFKNISVFGPPFAELNKLSEAASRLFQNGVRQSFVDDHTLNWLESRHDLRSRAVRLLSECSADGTSLYSQAWRCLRTYKEELGVPQVLMRSVTRKKLEEDFLIPMRSGRCFDRTGRYVQVSEEWYRFRKSLLKLSDQLSKTLRTALTEGRILCCEKDCSGTHLVAPTHAAELIGSKRKDEGHSFCFSRDLPKAWLPDEAVLNYQRGQAAKWMVRVHSQFEGLGRRVTAKQLKEVAQTKFSLTKNAASDAWESVSEKINLRLGRPTENTRVSKQEIIDLEI